MDDSLLIKRYRHSLNRFCYYVGRAQRLAEKKERGEYVDDSRVVETLSCLSSWKTYLLEDKESAGLKGGLSFLSDNRFLGFEIKEGRFIGDEDRVFPIIDKWLTGFPDTANNYQFEVAMFIMHTVYEVSEEVYSSAETSFLYSAA